ncbi:MAG: GNAT family N-acetyltransferase [Candidatus Eisenbacteria bacterium]|nr:GNAT family N-acetyltransferase [Candidatus Eisenbacteria bacterium]
MIRPIVAAETRYLRQAVLRPQQAAVELVYPGDDDPRTRHLGAFVGDRLVGISSIYVEPMPALSGDRPSPGVDPGTGDTDWRLRGMATLPEVRGTGLGGALLDACLDHVGTKGGTRLWCNARTTAAGFYLRHRFEIHGEEFELPGIGPHYRMSRAIPQSTEG